MGKAELIRQAQLGGRRALEELFARELPLLRRWAFANVPASVRRGGDTDDFVQLAILRTLRRLPHLRLAEEGKLQPYLRRVLINLVRDHTRAAGRRPVMTSLEEWDQVQEQSHLDRLVAAEAYARYQAATMTLSPRSRVALEARLERGLDYAAVARRARCASPAAARALVSRALARVAEELRDGATPPSTRRSAGSASLVAPARYTRAGRR